jgi:hypothetical protein
MTASAGAVVTRIAYASGEGDFIDFLSGRGVMARR